MSTTTFTIGNHYACNIPPEEFASVQKITGSSIITKPCFVCKLLSISGEKANIAIANQFGEYQVPTAWLSEIQKALPVGIESYLSPDPSRTDLFQHEEGLYHFPCSACIHVRGPAQHCQRCTHYVL